MEGIRKGSTVGIFIDQTPQGIVLSIRYMRANGEGFHQNAIKKYRVKSVEQAKAWTEKTFGNVLWTPRDRYTPEERLAWTVVEV